MAFGDADLGVFIEAAVFGVTVVYGATTTTGNKETWTEELLGGSVSEQHGTHLAVRVKASAFTPTLGGSITVDGTAYTVADFRLAEADIDGAFRLIKLSA